MTDCIAGFEQAAERYSIDEIYAQRAVDLFGSNGDDPNPGLHNPDLGPHVRLMEVLPDQPYNWRVMVGDDIFDVRHRFSRESLEDWLKATGLHKAIPQEGAAMTWTEVKEGLIKDALEVFEAHAAMRRTWGDWFVLPEKFDTGMFMLQELGEVADALRLNGGKYARNRGGVHKSREVDKELADLFLMTHTFYMQVSGQVEVPLWQQVTDMEDMEWTLEKLAELVVETVHDSQSGMATENVVRIRCIRTLAYILLYPGWPVAECHVVLGNWTKRAKAKAMLTYADELGFECKLRKDEQ